MICCKSEFIRYKLKVMPKFGYWLLVIGIWILLSVRPVFATASPTPGTPTCDLCGWCNRDENPSPPPNYAQCHDCLFNTDGTLRDKKYYTVFGCFSTDPKSSSFVQSILSIVFGTAGGIAFVTFIWGSAMVLTSGGDPVRLKNGRETIISSVMGLLLILFAVFLLRVVGYDILGIPGFER